MQAFYEQLSDWFNIIAPNPYLKGLLLLLLAYILARIADLILTKILKNVVSSTANQYDDKFIELFHKPVVTTIILIGAANAIHVMDLPELVDWSSLAIIRSFIIVYWMLFTIRFTRISLDLMSKKHNRFQFVSLHTLPLFNNLAMILIIGLALYFIFLSWDINLSAWVASAGIIGLALSFAAKDTLANLFSGVFILADSPYSLGHYIILESGERGMVTHIGIRSTRILTRDDIEITIPNSIMGNSKIINQTGGVNPKMRIRIKVSVAYGTDIDLVRKILLDTASDHSEIVMEPEPRVRFRHFGESGLDFELLCWINMPVLRGRAIDLLNEDVYKAFLENNIEIPYPKRDLYIKEQPSNN